MNNEQEIAAKAIEFVREWEMMTPQGRIHQWGTNTFRNAKEKYLSQLESAAGSQEEDCTCFKYTSRSLNPSCVVHGEKSKKETELEIMNTKIGPPPEKNEGVEDLIRQLKEVSTPITDEQSLQKEAEELYPLYELDGDIKTSSTNADIRQRRKDYITRKLTAAARKHSVTPVLSEQQIKEKALELHPRYEREDAAYISYQRRLGFEEGAKWAIAALTAHQHITARGAWEAAHIATYQAMHLDENNILQIDHKSYEADKKKFFSAHPKQHTE